MVTNRVTLFVVAVGVLGVGCEPEIGSPCDSVEKNVLALIQPKAGKNFLVQDAGFDNCTQKFCLSVDGSRPFCTKSCEADLECAEAGAGFTCSADVIAFGPLACRDFEDPTLPQPVSDAPSGEQCAVGEGEGEGEDCTIAGEECFLSGPSVGTCGFPGRDCLTGPNGGKSEVQLRYCAAPPDVIAARDVQYGRTP